MIKTSIKMKYSIINDFCDVLLIFITLFDTFYLSIMDRFSNYQVITFFLLILILLINFPRIISRVKSRDCLVYCLIVGLTVGNYLYFQIEAMEEILTQYLLVTVVTMFVAIVIDFEKYDYFIYSVSVIYIIANLYYVVFNYTQTTAMRVVSIDYMGFAYQILPATLITTSYFFNKRNIWTAIPMMLGIFNLIICGTRGPIVCVIFFCLINLLRGAKGMTRNRMIISFIIFFVAILFVFNIQNIARILLPLFERYRLSTRVLLYFASDSFRLGDTGRGKIYATILGKLKNNLLLGSGLMSDREMVGVYSHNIVIEIFNSFGIIIGFIIIFLLVIISIKAFRRTKSHIYKNYLTIYFSCSIVKLLISSSFIQETNFYIYLGLCLYCIRKTRQDTLSLQKY